jgi:hypothetical protein
MVKSKKSQIGAIFIIFIALILFFLIFNFIIKSVLPAIKESKDKAEYVSNDDFANATIEGSSYLEKAKIVKYKGNLSGII